MSVFRTVSNRIITFRNTKERKCINDLQILKPRSGIQSKSFDITSRTHVRNSEGNSKIQENQNTDNNISTNYSDWKNVLQLTDVNYKQHLQTKRNLFILFHAKWCKFCEEFIPVFIKIASNHDPLLGTLAACNVDKAPKMVDDLFIELLPTFKYIQDGRYAMNYSGERTEAGLQAFIRNMQSVSKADLYVLV
ncbi:hypothetical protein J6590_090157 [Homalodisca vitripennis]|nr:hypothetical protein J6590_090157 [Homalodisca vitripennis]